MAADQLEQGRHRPSVGRGRLGMPAASRSRRRLAGWAACRRRTGSRSGPPRWRSRPTGRCADLTAELTTMLGSTDPVERDETAYPMLATWVSAGCTTTCCPGWATAWPPGSPVGLGERDTDSVFRRSFSALVLGECIDRDNQSPCCRPAKMLEWGDRVAGWLLRERDVRGFVPGQGLGARRRPRRRRGRRARRVAALRPQRADGAARRDRRPGAAAETPAPLTSGEPDRLALATMAVLRRDSCRCGSSSPGWPG